MTFSSNIHADMDKFLDLTDMLLSKNKLIVRKLIMYVYHKNALNSNHHHCEYPHNIITSCNAKIQLLALFMA